MAATTTLLGLLTPTQGTLSGTWGDSVNYGISDYVDIAIAGTLSFAGDGAITLANTTGSSAGNAIVSTTAQYMVIRITGTQTVVKVITGPSYSKLYMVDHAGATSAVEFKRAGQVTPVTIAVGEKCFVYYNGTDYVKVASSVADGVTSVAMSVPAFLSVAGSPITSTGTLAVTLSGTALPVANGGTALTAGTSGGILAYTASGTLASSGVLAQYGVVIGGGAGAVPTSTAVGTATQVLTSNGSGVAPTFQAPAAGGIVYTTVKTANYTAVNNDGVQTNTTSGAFTVTLPATPSNGNQVFVVDSFNIWGTNNLTIGRNGSTIEGLAQDLVCDITGVSVQCIYNGTTWDIFAQVGGAGGSVVTGPASSTDNAIARFDLTTGKIIQNSVGILSDAGALSGLTSIDATGVITQNKGSAIILVLGEAAGQVSSTGTISIASEGLGVGADTRSGFLFRGRNTSGTLGNILELSGATGATVTKSLGIGGTTPSTSGVGITFPATQSASTDANTLDDYEEGTWTPSLGGTATYNSQQTALYTKVGRLVTVTFEIYVNVLGTGSTTTISGLPFTCTSASGARGSIGFFASLATNVIAISCSVQTSASTVVFNMLAASGSGTTNDPAIFGNSARIQGSLTYAVA